MSGDASHLPGRDLRHLQRLAESKGQPATELLQQISERIARSSKQVEQKAAGSPAPSTCRSSSGQSSGFQMGTITKPAETPSSRCSSSFRRIDKSVGR